jgi:peptide/nickel transport system permease protein
MPAPSPEPVDAPSLSERPGADLLTEAPAEVIFDAITADTHGEDEEGPRHKARKLGWAFWLAIGWITVVTLAAILAPWLPIKDPNDISGAIKEPPTWGFPATAEDAHWFGTDELGRDMFSRVIWGARVSLFIGVAAVALGMLIGGLIGLTAGYFRGWYEKIVMAAMDIMLAFPALVLALSIVTFLSSSSSGSTGTTAGSQQLDPSVSTVTLTLTILAVPALARITRASTLTFSQREFVQAARTLGAKNGRIMVREILPNVVPPMASFALIAIAIVIVAEGSLSFLGLSIADPASWGFLIQSGRRVLEEAPWITLIPCLIMFLTLLSFNLAGDQLRHRFDVKEVRL